MATCTTNSSVGSDVGTMQGRAARALGALTAVVTLTSLAACGDDSPRRDAGPDDVTQDVTLDPTDATTVSDLEQLRAGATAAAVDVRADGCGPRVGFGTGAMFDDDLAVTAAHVVAGSADVEVIDTEGRRSPAVVVSFDPDLDLAVLRTDTAVGTPIDIRPDEARSGERGVAALPRWSGGRLDLRVPEVTVTRTVNISTTDIYRDDEIDRAGFEITSTVDPGDSGALVVLPGGGAGVIWARSLRTDTSAWAIDLPTSITGDPGRRPEWTTPVDTGPCTR